MPPTPNTDLIGKRYIDPADSGALVMKVVAVDENDPDCVVWVHQTDIDRTWWRSAQRVRELIAISNL